MGEAKHAPVQEHFAGSAQALLERLRELEEGDSRAETRARVLLVFAAGSFVAALLGVWAAAATERAESAVVAVGFGLLAAFLLAVRWAVQQGDLEDRKLELVSDLVRRLAPELKAGRDVELDLDFRAHHRLRPKDVSSSGFGNSAQTFEHRWCELRVVLQDGTKAKLGVVTKAKRKTRRKRKYTKVKARQRDHVTVELAAGRGHAFATRELPRMSAPGGLSLARAQIKPRAARFDWAGPVLERVRSRHGWSVAGDLVTAPSALGALVISYKTLAVAQRQAA